MRLAIAALAAALPLAGTSAPAQDAAGTVENKAETATGSASAPAKPTEPRPRNQQLLDLLNELVRPRDTAVPAATAPAPVDPVTTPGATAPAPGPAGATAPAAAPTPPLGGQTQPSPAPPRPGAAAEPVRPVETSPAPAPASPARPVEAAPRDAAVPATAAAEDLAAAAEPDSPGSATARWLLLAAAAAAASVIHLRRTRRIARTRAALALEPRLDLAAGASTLTGLSLATPPLAIRARLEPSGASGG